MASNRGGKGSTLGTALALVLSITFLLGVMFFYPMTQGAKSGEGSLRWWGRIFNGVASCVTSLGGNCPLNVTNDNESPELPGGTIGGVGTAKAGAPANKSPEVVSAYLSTLEGVRVAEAEDGKYNPAEWNVWAINSSTMCSTRAEVLKAQGAEVVTKDGTPTGCSITGGTWVSPYDGRTIKVTQGEDVKAIRDGVQIDHIVPLKYAAEHGGKSWTAEEKSQFSNDVSQLVAVSESARRAKGDNSPANYMPQQSEQCRYSQIWVDTVKKYDLTITKSDKEALKKGLATCGQ